MIENILNELVDYMLSSKNIDLFTGNHNINDNYLFSINNNNYHKKSIKSQNENKNKNKNENKNENENNIKKDNCFWSFYFILYPNTNINIINIFKTENDFKLNSIIFLQNNKEIFKPHNFKKKNDGIENLHQQHLNLYGLHILCIIYKINIIYFNKYTYYEIIVCDKPINIINNKYEIVENINKEYIENNYIKINDIEKPLKSLSFYKKDDLISMKNKLKIKLDDKKSTKEIIYKKIYDLIKIE